MKSNDLVKNKSLKILSVLPDEISEEFFKEKIGSGDQMKSFQDSGVIKIDDFDNIIINKDCDEIVKITKLIKDDEIKQIHEDIVHKFYIPKLEDLNIDSFYKFKDFIQYFTNISYHLNCLQKYDESISYIFKIAKKLVYWGERDILISKLEEYDKYKISEINSMWKWYFRLFASIIVDDFQSYKEQDIETRFLSLQSSKDIDNFLFVELKNLEGIYWMGCKNDKEKALQIYNNVLKEFNSYNLDMNDNKNSLAYSRLLQNKALCYLGNDNEETFKIMNKAEMIIEKCNDKYELLKFYCNKLTFLYENNNNDSKIIDYLKVVNSYIKDTEYPDLERQYYNLISKMLYKDDQDFQGYFEIKSYVFQLDIILYYSYFTNDFLNMLDTIENDIVEKKFEIIKGLEYISSFLNEFDLNDEYYFILALQHFINEDEYKNTIKKIKIKPLVKIFNDYIKKIDMKNNHANI